jgi:hypothetical protein
MCFYHSPVAISYRLYTLQTPHVSLLKHFPVRLINPYNAAQPTWLSAFFFTMFYDHNFITQTTASMPLSALSSSFRDRTLGFAAMQVKTQCTELMHFIHTVINFVAHSLQVYGYLRLGIVNGINASISRVKQYAKHVNQYKPD